MPFTATLVTTAGMVVFVVHMDQQHDKVDTLDITCSVEQKTQICASFLLSESDGERDDVACVTLSYIVY